VPVVKAGSDAHWLAVTELRLARPDPGQAGATRVVAVGWRMIPNVGVPPSPAIAPLVAAIETNLAGILVQPLVQLDAPLDSRSSVLRTQEAAIGDVVADALRQHLAAEVALINGGALRGNRTYPAGYRLTRRDLLAEMPFNNTVEALEISGATLLAALEHSVSGVEDASGRFPQVSGMTVVYEPAAPLGSRVKSVKVNGQPLDLKRAYRLATTNYLAHGGDGYAMLEAAKVLVDASGGLLLVNIVAEAILQSGRLSSTPDGRLIMTSPLAAPP
jgi:2',3'-cyclic-nucleotide 2'-phosphodiesterase (5'-nucleotidase family)